MKRFITGSTMLLSVAALTGCAGGAAPDGNVGGDYTWDMSITTSETSAWWAGAEEFADILSDTSDGRIEVTVFANDSLSSGDTSAGIEQLMDGTKALSYNSAIQYSAFDDRFSAIAAPFLFSDYEQVDSVLSDPEVLQAYDELLASMGIKFLGFAENGFRHFSSNVKEILAPADFSGQKVRVPSSPLALDLFKSFGADPVVMSFNELFTSLQNGTVDAHENSIDLIHSGGLDEVTKYLTLSNYVFDPLILGMNLELFESLSPEDQEAVSAAATEANAFEIDFIRTREAEQLGDIESRLEVARLTDDQLAAFREFVKPIYAAWEPRWTSELMTLVAPKD